MMNFVIMGNSGSITQLSKGNVVSFIQVRTDGSSCPPEDPPPSIDKESTSYLLCLFLYVYLNDEFCCICVWKEEIEKGGKIEWNVKQDRTQEEMWNSDYHVSVSKSLYNIY